MARFNVILTRDVTESCTVTVDAADEADAMAAALERLPHIDAPGWELDDCASGQAYPTGCDPEGV